jgi:putative ABC transport system permease protein
MCAAQGEHDGQHSKFAGASLMRLLLDLLLDIRSAFKRRSFEPEMDEELRFHLEMQVADSIAGGMAPEEARLAALRAFGGRDQIKERCRDENGRLLSDFVQDALYGLRTLRRAPSFTVVVILSIALGAGINAAIFSLVNNQLLEPYIRDSTRHVVALYNLEGETDAPIVGITDERFISGSRRFSYQEFMELTRARGLFDQVSASEFTNLPMQFQGEYSRRFVELASANYFEMLGAVPFRGRFFNGAECRPNARLQVAVVTYDFWREAGRPENMVGSEIRVIDRNYRVVGIAPEGFGGLQASFGPDIWLPLGVEINLVSGGSPGDSWEELMGDYAYRLFLIASKNNALTQAQFDAALRDAAASLNRLPANIHAPPRRLLVHTIPRHSYDTRPRDESVSYHFAAFAIVSSAVVLLIACLNLTNLLLARGSVRQKEIAMRLCLGASRGRIVRQLLTEGFLMSAAGSVLGLVFGYIAVLSITRFVASVCESAGFAPFHGRPTIDGRVMCFMVLVCLVSVLVFSSGPALKLTGFNPASSLGRQREGSGGIAPWNKFFAFRNCLVMGQVAFSVVLLFAAGIIGRGTLKFGENLGFETDRRALVDVDMGYGVVPQAEIAGRQQALLEQVAAIPGVQRAALATDLPFQGFGKLFQVRAGGNDETASSVTVMRSSAVSDGFFGTLGIALTRGRDFTKEECSSGAAHPVVILNEGAARELFGNVSPLGRHIRQYDLGDSSEGAGAEAEVVGVVRNTHFFSSEDTGPLWLYRPMAASATRDRISTYILLLVERGYEMGKVLKTESEVETRLDPEIPLLPGRPVRNIVDNGVGVWVLRLSGMMIGVCGAVALVLGVVGVYGVKAYTVSSGARELAIRMALGAPPSHIFRLVMVQGILQTAVAIAAGSIIALCFGNIVSRVAYHMSPFDPATLLGAIGFVWVATLVACGIPALRAAAAVKKVSLSGD